MLRLYLKREHDPLIATIKRRHNILRTQFQFSNTYVINIIHLIYKPILTAAFFNKEMGKDHPNSLKLFLTKKKKKLTEIV